MPTHTRTASVVAAMAIIAGKMVVYPNEFALPLMPNFGLPPPPLGMVHIKVGGWGGWEGGWSGWVGRAGGRACGV